MINPSHPGQILEDVYFHPETEIEDVYDLWFKTKGISKDYLIKLVAGKASITEPVAIELARIFPTTTPKTWLNLQKQYDEANIQV
jgi:addiction module HigA family antidote